MIDHEQSLKTFFALMPISKEDKLHNRVTTELRPGDMCPECGLDELDYDGMLNLACPTCGLAIGGCFT